MQIEDKTKQIPDILIKRESGICIYNSYNKDSYTLFCIFFLKYSQ